MIIDKKIKQAHFIDVATPDSLLLHGIINGKLPRPKRYKKKANKYMATKKACMIPLAPLAPLYKTNCTKALKCLISALIYVF